MPKDNERTQGAGRHQLSSGVRVQLWGTSTGRWVPGYQIVAASHRGYVVRRLSDHIVLRHVFPEGDVRLDPIPMPPTRWTRGDAA